MISYGDITRVRLEHKEEAVNLLLQEGWILLCEPFIGLRKVETTSDNSSTCLIDIPWREFALGRRREV